MKNSTIAILFGLAALASSAGAASSVGQVTGVEIQDQGNGAAVFFAAGSQTGNKPGCATRSEWAFQAATSQGKAILAVLLSAQAQGRQVSVIGAGSCSTWGDREDVQRLVIVD